MQKVFMLNIQIYFICRKFSC